MKPSRWLDRKLTTIGNADDGEMSRRILALIKAAEDIPAAVLEETICGEEFVLKHFGKHYKGMEREIELFRAALKLKEMK
jgi:hypothetical protein